MRLIDKIRTLFTKTKGAGKALPKMPIVEPGIDIIVVSKEEILSGNISAVDAGLKVAINATKQAKEITTRLIILIGGYNEDPRELWQIPEVVSWYSKLNPAIAYWLDDFTIPVYIKVCACGLTEDMVRRIFAWSPETKNIFPPYNQDHKELAVTMLIYATGNKLCEELFGPDKKTAKHVIGLATTRINRSQSSRHLMTRQASPFQRDQQEMSTASDSIERLSSGISRCRKCGKVFLSSNYSRCPACSLLASEEKQTPQQLKEEIKKRLEENRRSDSGPKLP